MKSKTVNKVTKVHVGFCPYCNVRITAELKGFWIWKRPFLSGHCKGCGLRIASQCPSCRKKPRTVADKCDKCSSVIYPSIGDKQREILRAAIDKQYSTVPELQSCFVELWKKHPFPSVCPSLDAVSRAHSGAERYDAIVSVLSGLKVSTIHQFQSELRPKWQKTSDRLFTSVNLPMVVASQNPGLLDQVANLDLVLSPIREQLNDAFEKLADCLQNTSSSLSQIETLRSTLVEMLPRMEKILKPGLLSRLVNMTTKVGVWAVKKTASSLARSALGLGDGDDGEGIDFEDSLDLEMSSGDFAEASSGSISNLWSDNDERVQQWIRAAARQASQRKSELLQANDQLFINGFIGMLSDYHELCHSWWRNTTRSVEGVLTIVSRHHLFMRREQAGFLRNVALDGWPLDPIDDFRK